MVLPLKIALSSILSFVISLLLITVLGYFSFLQMFSDLSRQKLKVLSEDLTYVIRDNPDSNIVDAKLKSACQDDPILLSVGLYSENGVLLKSSRPMEIGAPLPPNLKNTHKLITFEADCEGTIETLTKKISTHHKNYLLVVRYDVSLESQRIASIFKKHLIQSEFFLGFPTLLIIILSIFIFSPLSNSLRRLKKATEDFEKDGFIIETLPDMKSLSPLEQGVYESLQDLQNIKKHLLELDETCLAHKIGDKNAS